MSISTNKNNSTTNHINNPRTQTKENDSYSSPSPQTNDFSSVEKTVSSQRASAIKPINENNIIYIKRGEKGEYSEKIKHMIYGLFSWALARQYQEEDLLFKITYDKVYRPELHKLICNSSPDNINITRNLFGLNEEKYRLVSVEENKVFLGLDEDSDLRSENNYVYKVVKYNKLSSYSKWILIGGMSLSFGLRFKWGDCKKTRIMFLAMMPFTVISLTLSSYFARQKTVLSKSFLAKEMKLRYENDMNFYKAFYYDDELDNDEE
mmetsp:Transcript_22857/g.23804  ORF Transcript_22857/g.23804 Transcript_22857/m.23804 type:complete len:264 (+) Transcript_22857:7-798(+)